MEESETSIRIKRPSTSKVKKEKSLESNFLMKLRSKTIESSKVCRDHQYKANKPTLQSQKKDASGTFLKKWLHNSKVYHPFVLDMLQAKTFILEQSIQTPENNMNGSEDNLEEVVYKKRRVIRVNKIAADSTYKDETQRIEIEKTEIKGIETIEDKAKIEKDTISQIAIKVRLLDCLLNEKDIPKVKNINPDEISVVNSSEPIRKKRMPKKLIFKQKIPQSTHKANKAKLKASNSKVETKNPDNVNPALDLKVNFQKKVDKFDKDDTTEKLLSRQKYEEKFQEENASIEIIRPGEFVKGDKPIRITQIEYEIGSDFIFTVEWEKSEKGLNLTPSKVRRKDILQHNPLLLVYFYERFLIFSKFPEFNSQSLRKISF